MTHKLVLNVKHAMSACVEWHVFGLHCMAYVKKQQVHTMQQGTHFLLEQKDQQISVYFAQVKFLILKLV